MDGISIIGQYVNTRSIFRYSVNMSILGRYVNTWSIFRYPVNMSILGRYFDIRSICQFSVDISILGRYLSIGLYSIMVRYFNHLPIFLYSLNTSGIDRDRPTAQISHKPRYRDSCLYLGASASCSVNGNATTFIYFFNIFPRSFFFTF